MGSHENIDLSSFMINHFDNIPTEIQYEIIRHVGYKMTRPIFKKGTVVKFIKQKREDLLRQMREKKSTTLVEHREFMAAAPYGRLIICDNTSIFNWKLKQWEYEYEYGAYNNRRGNANENELEYENGMRD